MGLKKVEKPIRKKTKLKKDGRIILEESFLQDKNPFNIELCYSLNE
jgi:hypothetical protein